MIYTVECSFAEPTREEEWNEFYSEMKLSALISVTGFHTSQRFKAISSGCPTYLAAHTVEGLEVLSGDEYAEKGGGNFARWQPDIIDWHRNLYSGPSRVPDISANEYLVLGSTGPDALTRLGLIPHPMRAVAMEKNPERRWLAATTNSGFTLPAKLPDGVHVYVAITPQLRATASPAAFA
ncbi:MAG TPA: hypothetical protein VIS09_19800 [Streptomyces sp.]